MAKRPKIQMLPTVRGCTIDMEGDEPRPTKCIVGLLTEDGVTQFALSKQGAKTMMLALQTFLDRVDAAKREAAVKRQTDR
ncbi:hypothetical protein [Mesorhizobium loti]|uniref:hypothetical protein n=1 Tax=Rhizobium loti TaxID=381 RepID=UPI00068575A1|nr:hypothetical protein [Mesorhizobium loti]